MNNINIIGRLGADAEVKQTETNQIIKFSVAVDDGKDRPVIWFRCTKWITSGGSVKIADHIKKGDMIGVSGKVNLSEYNGKVSLEINVNNITLCGGKMPF